MLLVRGAAVRPTSPPARTTCRTRPTAATALDETVGWHVTLPWSSPAVTYVIRKNNLAEIGRGSIKPGIPANIEAKLDEPGMVYVEVTENTRRAPSRRALGAVVAAEKIGAAIPEPPDFDAFWSRRSRRCARCP